MFASWFLRQALGLAVALTLVATTSAADADPDQGARQPDQGMPIPRIIGHRGLIRHAPENTLAGFAACIDLRLGFELDVRRSKDGQLVVMHDDDVKRTTNGSGKVSEMTLADLKRLDAGAGFDAAFAGQKVPSLEEVFVLLKAPQASGVLVALDLKVDDDETLADVVTLAKKHGVLGQVMCIGKAIDSAEVRRKLKAADTKIAVAVLAQTADDLAAALADKNSEWVYLRFMPTAEQVARAHKASKRVLLVGPTVAGEEVDNWQRARQAGVDSLLTDYPLECRRSWR
jgi:glycerophosphoryl diester phosphodiesterase